MAICGTNRSLPTVPRSKGCLNCVARKTGCGLYGLFGRSPLLTFADGRRPTCQACEKRGQTCRGYRRDNVVFLAEDWRALGVASTKPAKEHTPAHKCHDATRVTVSTSRTASLPASPGITGSQLCIPFFLASFGKRPEQAPTYIGQLFEHYCALDEVDDNSSNDAPSSSAIPVTYAVHALARVFFGAAHGDRLSMRKSLDSYEKALRSMSRWMTRKNLSCLHEDDWQHLAFFCLVMAFCEACPHLLRHSSMTTLTFMGD